MKNKKFVTTLLAMALLAVLIPSSGHAFELDLTGKVNLESKTEIKRDGEWFERWISFRKEKREADPKIMLVNAVRISDDSARIIWFTNKPTDSKVWLDDDENIDVNEGPYASSSVKSFFHSVDLKDLENDTEYYFIVGGEQNKNKVVLSAVGSFTTD